MTIKEIEKALPKGESIAVRYVKNNGDLCFVMSTDYMRTSYTLYEYKDGKLKRVGKGANPLTLEERYSVSDAIA